MWSQHTGYASPAFGQSILSLLALTKNQTPQGQRMLMQHFWKERTFWSDGYFCCTVGNASQEGIRHYIESLGPYKKKKR